jgi:hypothetical protein
MLLRIRSAAPCSSQKNFCGFEVKEMKFAP